MNPMRQLFLLLLLVSGVASAQSLHDAVEKAWERQPAAQAQMLRRDELAARLNAASAWLPSPPSVALRQRTDRLNSNNGSREYEAELAIPLWLPGQSEKESAVVSAEQDLQRDSLAAAKWKLAGEVRESYWQTQAANIDLLTALRRRKDSIELVADVERRLKAGDLARTDFNQAKGAEQAARVAVSEAELRLIRAQATFVALTGLDTLPAEGENLVTHPPPSNEHPLLRQLERAANTADARMRLASSIKRDNPELTLGLRRERGSNPEPYANSLTVGIRIPFATDGRNQPRIAAANADFIESSTALARERERLASEVRIAQGELDQTRSALDLAEERQRLAIENDQLIAKAFSLGEIDLASRLRAATERYAAVGDFARSRLESARAISRLNQAFGVLP